VDVSGSIDDAEYELQLKGYAATFRDPKIRRAVQSGPLGRIACMMIAWSDVDYQEITVPWTLLESEQSFEQFAKAIDNIRRVDTFSTNIFEALNFAIKQFGTQYESTRQVIDVSGDGKCTSLNGPGLARDLAVKKGIVINGLPILDYGEDGKIIDNALGNYYAEHVIGGPGAFVIIADGFDEFGLAVRKKIIREISSAPDHGPRIEYA
jgi:hypothetical protein